MVFAGRIWMLILLALCSGEKWRFPEEETASSVRIDTKVKFVDNRDGEKVQTTISRVQLDDVPFREPTETEGFYNRPAGAGRYPVRVESHRAPYQVEQGIYAVHSRPSNYVSEGADDGSQLFCKCVSSPDCKPRPNSQEACGSNKYLCCYTQPHRGQHNSEFFNEIDDERPALYPGQQNLARPFPPPPDSEINGLFGPGHSHDSGLLGALDRPRVPANQGVLVGPDGPTGVIGPAKRKPNVFTGPGGPTGIVGPAQNQAILTGSKDPGLLVGPNGPTGHIGPVKNQNHFGGHNSEELTHSETAQRGVLVGPGGPTGVIGPGGFGRRPVLVGPGGPTGVIGPGRRQGVLVGPGGPTGVIGPRYGRQYSQYNPGVLVGPGGPAGVIGPGRQLLTGPGGPTGQIGPYG